MINLYPHQVKAIKNLSKGSILCGGVGSGKSLTALSWYYLQNGGSFHSVTGEEYKPMDDPPSDLYIITTARKRDTFEWQEEMVSFLLPDLYSNEVVVDSWNNIEKYADIQGAYFIFDEQRVIGNGTWVKTFLKIAPHNEWIMLSATPGDTWQDYIPVFIANGFYKNRSAFIREHVVYNHRLSFPKVDRYLKTGKLIQLRNQILVTMDFDRKTDPCHIDVCVTYDINKYKDIGRLRWNPYKDKPIVNAAELCYTWRKIVNSDQSRQLALLEICEKHPKVIIFYNFDYELDILKGLAYMKDTDIAEWNGYKHQPLPTNNSWVYLVQYTAGCEGWNCIQTDTVVFYSQSYSYKVMTQAAGRIDRLNTPYTKLYYYHLRSRSGIDLAISKALKEKRRFNESSYVKW